MKVRQGRLGGFALGLLGVALGQTVHAAEDAAMLDDVVVSSTREAQKKSEVAATVGKVSGEALRAAKASHPSQIMGRVPGVWVNITGGEGHQTAIRQPLTTNPVYAYLEDGIPVRSTGFFNHNALYEINLPQSGGIEVTKGPGSALYGSDAIGGVVNVLSRRPPSAAEVEASGELGSFGWKRALISGGNAFGNNGVRADLNLTRTDGWRDATGYTRNSGTVRWDRALGEDAMLKVLGTFSDIDQQTAGSSAISQADYLNNPTVNYTPISLRKVKALRLSAAYEKETANTLLSVTPYVRDDSMDLLANWSLGYDPTLYNTSNQSFGVLAKYRMDFEPYRSRLIVGIDVDHSPGGRTEDSILTTKVGSVYTAYTLKNRIYDYKVTYQGVSPYVHGEMSPTAALRLTGGLRYDDMSYDFSNNLAAAAIQGTGSGTKWYGQSASTKTNYSHLSPKLGATYAFSDRLNGFATYNHSFRAPSEGQLFRPAATSSALQAQQIAAGNLALKPVKVDSYETGLRGKTVAGVSWEASLYRMIKRDDVLTQKDPATNAPISVNGGKTLHRGLELGVSAQIADALKLELAYSYAKHSYEEWVTNTANFTGKEMALAPRVIANTRLSYAPGYLHGGNFAAEVVTLGSYWMDDANTTKYSGHDLLNLSASYRFDGELELFAKFNNLTDRRFAESTNGTTSYAPGMPRTFYLGLQNAWR
ncbi:MAG: TonB-dependent receptor [Gallionellales bacterium GWA2_60_18]|nr:MAG: TonB-dependent receptor [Gallionellales bacterium GWA2_60_18]